MRMEDEVLRLYPTHVAAENADEIWDRLWSALAGMPLVINTEPPLHPAWANRLDRLDHAYINVFTEGWRYELGRPPGDETSQLLGQITGILLFPVLAVPLLLTAGVLRVIWRR